MGRENRSRSIKTHRAERVLRLPAEIIEEILSRLPVKSLLKFRCVSKSWLYLIGSQSFIKTHLKNSTKNTTHHKIILNHFPYACRLLRQCSWQSLLNEPVFDLLSFHDMNNIRWEFIDLVGCCNGLVCIRVSGNSYYLWNPTTRVSKKLPDTEDINCAKIFVAYGFGYDDLCNDYKVYSNFFVNSRVGCYGIGRVYSLKSNSWKTLMNGCHSIPEGSGKFASGNLHWILKKGDILSFDLKSEVYSFVELPSCSKDSFNSKTLGVIEGCLSVVCGYPRTRIDVWVMKQYGVKESWVKVATLPNIHDPSKGKLISPFAWGPNGEILLLYRCDFRLYYSKDEGIPRRVNIAPVCDADVYVESLVSLASDDEQERQP